ncbi:hypothetical protein ACVW0K_007374 [Streptomyces filamentosus]
MDTTPVVLAVPIEEIGDHLLTVGGTWAEKALMVAILIAVLVTVCTKMSLKAGFGALVGLVICLGIYQSKDELANAFKETISNVSTQTPAPSAPPASGS